MSVRKLRYYGDPILRQKAKKLHRFDSSLPKLVQDMYETMHANDGAGLAAPQIGLAIRLLVVENDREEAGPFFKLAIANPEIIKSEGIQTGVDGCLSIPGYYGVNIQRADQIVVKGQDMRGEPIQVKAQGYFAWALQHEIDHLNGILYLDHLNRPEDLRRIREDDDVGSEESVEIDDLIKR